MASMRRAQKRLASDNNIPIVMRGVIGKYYSWVDWAHYSLAQELTEPEKRFVNYAIEEQLTSDELVYGKAGEFSILSSRR